MKATNGAARRIFDAHVQYLRELAKEKNIDFDVLLNALMPPESKNIRLAALLKAPHAREATGIERYRPYFYEWQIDDVLMVDAEAHHQHLLSKIRGGKMTAEKLKMRSNERQSRIIAKRAELIQAGEKPHGMNKRIAKLLSDETEYVRKCLREFDKRLKAAES